MPMSHLPCADTIPGITSAQSINLIHTNQIDWSSTSVGSMETWPEDLRSVSRVARLSPTPTAILIGGEGLVFLNDAARAIFGPRATSFLGRPIAEILPDTGDVSGRILECALSKRPSSLHGLHLELPHATGKTIWFDLDFTPIENALGEVLGTLVICIDTTSRMRALDDLRNSRERLDLALQSGGIVGTWEVDFTRETVRSDERYARLHGVDPEIARTGADKDLFFRNIHPDDIEHVRATFDRAKRGGYYRCQHRVVGFEGTRWIVASGHIRCREDGTPLSFAGTAVDVTAQVEITAALAESERRFRTYAETLPHVIFNWDRDGRAVYANHRWHEFVGLDEADPKAKDWLSFLHPDDRALAIVGRRQAIAEGRRYDAIVRYRHHSGDYFWMHAVALPLRDDGGNITQWIGTLTDVHDAKLLETERDLVSRELDHRIKNFFSVTQGLVGLTARESRSVETFAARLRERLTALHHSHGLIRRTAGTPRSRTHHSLHALIRELLAPYTLKTDEERLAVDGDDIAVDEGLLTAFALVFHELATNSVKYGALCRSEGRIRFHSTDTDGSMRLVWEESCPVASSPGEAEPGFGSRMIDLIVEGQMNGRFQRFVTPGGIRAIIEIPAKAFAAPRR